jgi:hypothetical protein
MAKYVPVFAVKSSIKAAHSQRQPQAVGGGWRTTAGPQLGARFVSLACPAKRSPGTWAGCHALAPFVTCGVVTPRR